MTPFRRAAPTSRPSTARPSSTRCSTTQAIRGRSVPSGAVRAGAGSWGRGRRPGRGRGAGLRGHVLHVALGHAALVLPAVPMAVLVGHAARTVLADITGVGGGRYGAGCG